MYGLQVLGSERKARKTLRKAGLRYWDAVRRSPLTFRFTWAGDALLALRFLDAFKIKARLVFQI